MLLAGWYDQSELPELLAAADLLVLPSARESFGQVIVEAMACGVPAVAAASLGPAKIIDDGKTGWLFGVDDRAACADALVAATGDPAERARRADAGETAALARFTWPAVAGRLDGILRQVPRAVACGAAAQRRDDALAVAVERRLLRVVHEVDVELVDAERLELAQLGDVVLDRAEHAEAVDDLVGHELGVRVAGAPVVGVVVALAGADVVRQRLPVCRRPPRSA